MLDSHFDCAAEALIEPHARLINLIPKPNPGMTRRPLKIIQATKGMPAERAARAGHS